MNSKILQASRIFLSDVSASVLPIFSFAVLLVVVVAGSGADLATALGQKAKAGNALDGAALKLANRLSVARMSEKEISTELTKAFSANLEKRQIEFEAIRNLDYVVDWDHGVLDVTTVLAVPTQFIGMGGIGPKELAIGVQTQVSFSSSNLELALVLDVTGSMEADIDGLREASSKLVETLLPEGERRSQNRTRVSLVPYSQGVNLGPYAKRVTNGHADENNCVATRFARTAAAKAIGNMGGERSSVFVAPGAMDYFVVTTGSDTSWYPHRSNCPQTELVPLTSDSERLQAAISSLEPQGGTAGQAGIAWGWSTLSWSWHSLWPRESDPDRERSSRTRKAAVIMTDGDFNVHYTERFQAGCPPEHDTDGEDSDHGSASLRPDDDDDDLDEGDDDRDDDDWDDDDDGRGDLKAKNGRARTCRGSSFQIEEYLPNANLNSAPAQEALELCTAMKNSGVVVYTVYFRTTGSEFGKDLMKSCASDSAKFYLAKDSNDLKAAFGSIARNNLSVYLAR